MGIERTPFDVERAVNAPPPPAAAGYPTAPFFAQQPEPQQQPPPAYQQFAAPLMQPPPQYGAYPQQHYILQEQPVQPAVLLVGPMFNGVPPQEGINDPPREATRGEAIVATCVALVLGLTLIILAVVLGGLVSYFLAPGIIILVAVVFAHIVRNNNTRCPWGAWISCQRRTAVGFIAVSQGSSFGFIAISQGYSEGVVAIAQGGSVGLWGFAQGFVLCSNGAAQAICIAAWSGIAQLLAAAYRATALLIALSAQASGGQHCAAVCPNDIGGFIGGGLMLAAAIVMFALCRNRTLQFNVRKLPSQGLARVRPLCIVGVILVIGACVSFIVSAVSI